nr:hypothetical protein [Tanacetum cinerariifolium]
MRDVSEGEACPTASGFIVDQDRATIANLQRQYSELMSKFQAQEEEIGRLKERVQVLEDKEGVATKQSGEDAPIKGRSNNEREEAAERISNDSEEIARVLTSMDAATIARDAEVARIHAEEEIQGMIDSLDKSNEIIAKYLQEYQQFALELPLEKKIELISDLGKYQEHYTKVHKFQSQQRRPMTKKQKREYYMAVIKSNLGWRFKDFKGMTFEEIEAKFGKVWKQIEDFFPMGSKEETERLKRKGLNLEKEQLVPVEDVYVQALQVKHPIIDWKVHSEDLLRQLDREDLNQLWALVKEYL